MMDDSQKELDYLNILVRFKEDRNYIKSMFDKSTEDVLMDIQTRYATTEKIARRIINTSIRSLLKDNASSILDNIKKLEEQIAEYKVYVDNPRTKLMSDIEELLGKYAKEEKNAQHIENESQSYKVRLGRRVLKLTRGAMYFMCYSNNEVKVAYGEDIPAMDRSSVVSILSADWEYYFLYDGRGCCTVTRDVLLKSGSKLNSDYLKGAIGINDLNEITVKQGNKKVYKGVDWSLRSRSAYIRLSKDKEPEFEILTTHNYAPN